MKYLMPTLIANAHDDMIQRFLSKSSKNNHKISLNSWMKVKQGFVVPVNILTYPFVDLKHDMRFIAIIRPRKDITLDEKTIP